MTAHYTLGRLAQPARSNNHLDPIGRTSNEVKKVKGSARPDVLEDGGGAFRFLQNQLFEGIVAQQLDDFPRR